MRLYLIQHGESAPEEVDPSRPLTDKGKSDVAGTAGFLKKAGARVDEVWHSTKLRAKQTAELLGLKAPVEKQGLKPNDPVAPIAKLIEKSETDLAIVGHLPFLSKLTSLLVCGKEDQPIVQFKQGGALCLEKQESGFVVCWMVMPGL